MSAIMHAHQKRYVLSAFFAFLLVVVIDSLIPIQILTFSFPFFNQIDSYWFQEGCQEKWQAHGLSSSPALCFLAKDDHGHRPRLLRRSHFLIIARLRLIVWHAKTSFSDVSRNRKNVSVFLFITLNIISIVIKNEFESIVIICCRSCSQFNYKPCW